MFFANFSTEGNYHTGTGNPPWTARYILGRPPSLPSVTRLYTLENGGRWAPYSPAGRTASRIVVGGGTTC